MTPFLLLGPHAASDPWVWGLAPPTAQATPKLQKLYPLSPGSRVWSRNWRRPEYKGQGGLSLSP